MNFNLSIHTLFREGLGGLLEKISEQAAGRPRNTADREGIKLGKNLKQGKVL